MKKLIKGENDLQTKSPLLAEEWDYEKNEKLPSEYAFKSNISVFWKCKKCGYVYKAKISNRAIGRGCPCCAGKVAVLGINDLTTTHPQLATEWHPTKNGELTPEKVTSGRSLKVWWLCPEGHAYQATILHRSSGTNCPKCNAGRQTSFAEQAVFYYVKKLYPDAISRYTEVFNNRMELDIYIPSIRLGIEYDGIAWHTESRFEKEREKYEICQKNKIKLLRLKEKQVDRDRLTADYILSLGETTALYEHKNLTRIIQFLLDKINPKTYFWTRREVNIIHSSVEVDISRDEMAKSKGVQMIDIDTKDVIKTFKSISEASRQMGISSGNISAVCRGVGRKQAGGYIWRYYEIGN